MHKEQNFQRANPNDDAARIASLFDNMAAEYDDISDFWYSWLFSRLHYFLARRLSQIVGKWRFLDVGCGTGFQSNLIALFGHDVIGIDISLRLIERACQKSSTDFASVDLFPSSFKFARDYSREIRTISSSVSPPRSLGRIGYCQASATEIPLSSATMDAVVCCGSTLNFVGDYIRALNEMGRVLRPGGVLFLEVENRYNLDLLWALLDGMLPIDLGFEQKFLDSLRNITAPPAEHVVIDYPFETHESTVKMPLRLFSVPEFKRELRAAGFRIEDYQGIHVATNILPSTLLHRQEPSWLLRAVSGYLGKIDEAVSSLRLLRSLGCSVVYTVIKNEGPEF
jgi:ubiquinone/menaquinone biosynthesis C-methylase UbiE